MEKTLVAYDFSGSTEENEFYHSTVQTILKEYEPYEVVLWDNKLQMSSPQELKRINRWKEGRGGTVPLVVAQHLYDTGFDGRVVLITDGQIFERYVKQLDEYLESHPLKITRIECFLIYTCEKLDATVIAPFLSRYNHIVYLYDDGAVEPRLLVQGGKSFQEFVEQLQSIKTIEEFEAQYDTLFSETISKVLGKTNDTAIKDEILKLRTRLVNTMKEPPKGFNMEDVAMAYDQRDVPTLLKLCQDLDVKYHDTYPSPEWPGKIFHLLRMCSGNLSSVFSLSALSSKYNADRVRRADIVQNFEISDVDVIDSDQKTFICPISYEEESDVVILMKKPDSTLLEGLDADFTNALINNPLNAFNSEDFLKKFASMFDVSISLRTMQEAEKAGHPIKQSPLTRAEVIGGLCLGADEGHCKATDYIISKLVSGGRRVGNNDLWFAIIWYIIESSMVPHLKEVLPQVREHLLFRLQHHKGTLSLTNVPFFTLTKVPLGVACWYPLNAFAAGSCERDAINGLKPHLSIIPMLRKINELQKLPMDPKAEIFLRKAHAFLNLRFIAQKEDNEALSNVIRLGFKCVPVNLSNISNDKFKWVPHFIPIDGEKPTEEERKEALSKLPQSFALLTESECRSIAKIAMVHNFSAMKFDPMNEEYEAISWKNYGLKHFDIPEVKICPATMRPYSLVKPSNITWEQNSQEIFGPIDQQIHIHKLYLEYVIAYKQFPTTDDLLVYAFNYHVINGNKLTLPMQILDFVNCVCNGYKEALETKPLQVNEFLHTVHLSVNQTRRLNWENEYLSKQ